QRHFRKRVKVNWRGRQIHPPIVVDASVSSGKSIMIAELAKAVRLAAISGERRRTVRVLVIQRQGELCQQNSDADLSCNDEHNLLQNSLFSASCGKSQSTHVQVVYATENTLAIALGIGAKLKGQYCFTAYTPEELAKTPEQ